MDTASERTATVYRNGRILTLDGSGVPEALAVRDGRVAAAGTLGDVRRAAGSRAAEVDLRGARLLPGFVDTRGGDRDARAGESRGSYRGGSRPLAAPVEDLPATRVLPTVVGGEPVHDLGELWRSGRAGVP